MQATKALTHSQRASQALVVLQITAITFDMSAMVGRHPPQLKMPRLDAYGVWSLRGPTPGALWSEQTRDIRLLGLHTHLWGQEGERSIHRSPADIEQANARHTQSVATEAGVHLISVQKVTVRASPQSEDWRGVCSRGERKCLSRFEFLLVS